VYYVFGLVLDGTDTPVANADVSGFPGPGGSGVRTTTDAAGRYELHSTSPSNGTFIQVKKSGYDQAEYYVPLKLDDNTERNLHLYQGVSIAAGESIPVVIKPDDPSCGFDSEYLCRMVHVRISDRGTLTVDATADNKAVTAGVGLDPLPPSYAQTAHFSMSVAPGSDVPIDVLRGWNDQQGTQTITLTTHFQSE
jgi:hypothetical protein